MVVSPDDLLNALRLYCFKRGLELTLPQIRVARAVFYLIAREREMRDFFFGAGTGKSTLFDAIEQFGKLACHYNYELCASEERPFDPRGYSPLRILYPIWNGARIEGQFEQQTMTVDSRVIKGTLTGPCGHCGALVVINIVADDAEIVLLCGQCREKADAGVSLEKRSAYVTRDDDHQPCAAIGCLICNPPRLTDNPFLKGGE